MEVRKAIPWHFHTRYIELMSFDSSALLRLSMYKCPPIPTHIRRSALAGKHLYPARQNCILPPFQHIGKVGDFPLINPVSSIHRKDKITYAVSLSLQISNTLVRRSTHIHYSHSVEIRWCQPDATSTRRRR